MRTITIPKAVMDRVVNGPMEGRALVFSVAVDWPELRLTESQILENAIWETESHRRGARPHPDRSIFAIEIPYAPRGRAPDLRLRPGFRSRCV